MGKAEMYGWRGTGKLLHFAKSGEDSDRELSKYILRVNFYEHQNSIKTSSTEKIKICVSAFAYTVTVFQFHRKKKLFRKQNEQQ